MMWAFLKSFLLAKRTRPAGFSRLRLFSGEVLISVKCIGMRYRFGLRYEKTVLLVENPSDLRFDG